MTRLFVCASLAGIAVVLSGCGGGQPSTPAPGPAPRSPTPAPKPRPSPGPPTPKPTPEPTPEPTPAHIDCSLIVNATIPDMPDVVTDLNGKAWPPACFNQESAHFFVLGDWGGLCNWGDNECHPGVPGNLGKGMPPGAPGMPVPMPNDAQRHSFTSIEPFMQATVRDRMINRTTDLKQAGSPPKFLINVGDNFYPGGVDVHCGADKPAPAITAKQFEQIWDKFYPAEDLENMEWWSVLGNHDYGGVCFIKGWDKQIEYTWEDKSRRWVMPGQYWKRKVYFAGFTADFWFVDGNYYDVHADAAHSPCAQNPGPYCPLDKYPPPDPNSGGSCPKTGPVNAGDCQRWFQDLWNKQNAWLREEVPKSDADWQIIVNHYPPSYAQGDGADQMVWASWMNETGVDLYISGHTHEQRAVYRHPFNGQDFGDTAFVISGGGGGISSEIVPDDHGHDDAYGFMDMEISKNEIKILAFSHGGKEGMMIVRQNITVKPNKNNKKSNKSFPRAEILI